MPIEVSAPAPRAAPVIVLADTSGSMSVDGKIDVLNDSINRMLRAFRQLDLPGCEIVLSVISFGGDARVHIPPTPVDQAEWKPLAATGRTPLGAAFDVARQMLEDPDAVPSRSYKPNLVLVSDGIPTDEWQSPLKALDESTQGSRALRFAVGIGAEAKHDVLRQFAGVEGQVVPVEDVELLTEFFRYVTMTVTQAAQRPVQSQAELPTFESRRPNEIIEF